MCGFTYGTDGHADAGSSQGPAPASRKGDLGLAWLFPLGVPPALVVAFLWEFYRQRGVKKPVQGAMGGRGGAGPRAWEAGR